METLFLGMQCWQRGQKGFYSASEGVDPESLVTPWLITCWLGMVVQGFRRSHGLLRGLYDLDGIRTLEKAEGWQEAAGYFGGFGLKSKRDSHPPLMDVLGRYSRRTGQFLFGTPSQYRGSVGP